MSPDCQGARATTDGVALAVPEADRPDGSETVGAEYSGDGGAGTTQWGGTVGRACSVTVENNDPLCARSGAGA